MTSCGVFGITPVKRMRCPLVMGKEKSVVCEPPSHLMRCTNLIRASTILGASLPIKQTF
jgi:hypothetical protein